jgi:DNA (cytosine-5)-methyltransferase 1
MGGRVKKLLSIISDGIHKLGLNRGIPRIWLEGVHPQKAGFAPGTRYDVAYEGNTLTIRLNPDGSRTVSKKDKGEKPYPVIDINNPKLGNMFVGMNQVRVIYREGTIHILPLASESRRVERLDRLMTKMENGEPLAVASLAHGGGILTHALHSGLQDAGIQSKLAVAVEIRPGLLSHASECNDAWNDQTISLAMSIQELAFDEWTISQIPKVDILEAGIPCSGASKAGRSKRSLLHPEDHPDVGHLITGALAIIAKFNPSAVVFECVTEYEASASGGILRNQLRDFGYEVHEAVIDGAAFNCLEHRKRWCLVAVTRGMSFDFDMLEKPELIERSLGEILETIENNDPRWSEMRGLKDKEIRDKVAGKGFQMQIFGEESSNIKTLTKGYAKVRSTDPKIAHPENPDLLRQITPIEHARCKGIPEHLIKGLSNTLAHEVLGQSVLYEPFRRVGRLLGQFIGFINEQTQTAGIAYKAVA